VGFAELLKLMKSTCQLTVEAALRRADDADVMRLRCGGKDQEAQKPGEGRQRGLPQT